MPSNNLNSSSWIPNSNNNFSFPSIWFHNNKLRSFSSHRVYSLNPLLLVSINLGLLVSGCQCNNLVIWLNLSNRTLNLICSKFISNLKWWWLISLWVKQDLMSILLITFSNSKLNSIGTVMEVYIRQEINMR